MIPQQLRQLRDTTLAWVNGRIEERCNIGDFAPEQLVSEGGTLYIISPPISRNDWGGAPAVVSILDAIREAARKRGVKSGLNMLWELDEAATIAPVDIPGMLRESRGYGIYLLIGAQSWGDVKERYGENLAQGIFTNCSNKVIWGGGDPQLLGDLEKISQSHWVTDPGGEKHRHKEPVWTVEKLTHLPRRRAVVFSPPTPARGYPTAWYQALWEVELLHGANLLQVFFGAIHRDTEEVEDWLVKKHRSRLLRLIAVVVVVLIIGIVMMVHK
jgi:type IV secretory pathway TraG/TraD family ATPase VirD4